MRAYDMRKIQLGVPSALVSAAPLQEVGTGTTGNAVLLVFAENTGLSQATSLSEFLTERSARRRQKEGD